MGKEILLKSLFIVLWNFKLKLCESAWLRLESWRCAANEIGRDFICARVANLVRALDGRGRRREYYFAAHRTTLQGARVKNNFCIYIMIYTFGRLQK
jgi:hypothetical protein